MSTRAQRIAGVAASVRTRLEEFKSATGRYAHKSPVRALKRPQKLSPRQRLWLACDDAYLLERGGFEVEEAWKLACMGNGLDGEG